MHSCLRLRWRAFKLFQLHFTVLLSVGWTTVSKGCFSLQQRRQLELPHILQSTSLFTEVPLCLIWVLKKYHHSIKTLISVYKYLIALVGVDCCWTPDIYYMVVWCCQSLIKFCVLFPCQETSQETRFLQWVSIATGGQRREGYSVEKVPQWESKTIQGEQKQTVTKRQWNK